MIIDGIEYTEFMTPVEPKKGVTYEEKITKLAEDIKTEFQELPPEDLQKIDTIKEEILKS